MSIIMIYYNLVCGILCNVLGLICNSGEELVIIEYLKMLFDCEILKVLIVVVYMLVCVVLCEKGMFYVEFGLDDLKWSDE